VTEDERLSAWISRWRASTARRRASSAPRQASSAAAGIEEEVRLTREFMADQRIFTTQVVARMERSARDGMRELSRMNDDLERQSRELERQGAERRAESAERRAEARMGRAALLRVLDRLDRIDPGSSATSG